MGWWRAGADGSSLHAEETGLVWGDGPADIMDDAIDKITDEFQAAYGRKPSRIELEAGLQFSLGVYEEQEPGSSGCPVGHQRPCAGCTWCEEKWRRRWSVPAEDVMPDAAVPEGEDPLTWLRMALQGYGYLLALPQPGLATWQEACDRGLRRIRAACRVVANAIRED